MGIQKVSWKVPRAVAEQAKSSLRPTYMEVQRVSDAPSSPPAPMAAYGQLLIGRTAYLLSPWLQAHVHRHAPGRLGDYADALFPDEDLHARIERINATRAGGPVKHWVGLAAENAARPAALRAGFLTSEVRTTTQLVGPTRLRSMAQPISPTGAAEVTTVELRDLAVEQGKQGVRLGSALVRTALMDTDVPRDASVHFTVPEGSVPDLWARSHGMEPTETREVDLGGLGLPGVTMLGYTSTAGAMLAEIDARNPWLQTGREEAV